MNVNWFKTEVNRLYYNIILETQKSLRGDRSEPTNSGRES